MSPFIKELNLQETPRELFLKVGSQVDHLAFLESDESEGENWSILAWNPIQLLSYDGQQVFLNSEPQEGTVHQHMTKLLQERHREYSGELPFIGGAIGSIDYEYGYELLELSHQQSKKSLLEWAFYNEALVYQHDKKQWFSVSQQEGCSLLQDISGENSPKILKNESINLIPSWEIEKYLLMFSKLKEFIRIGEIYQACLTFPFFSNPVENPRQLFSELLEKNTSPMAAFLQQSQRSVLSLSPERFIKWNGTQIETKPIKGTRPRSPDPFEDEQLRNQLLEDKKERAELNMITDLLRNDLSKVSQPGSVQVQKLAEVMACPNVWHTYSHIAAETNPNTKAWDIVEAMFPGGSISGCPKRRAVEILSELEDHPRGIYTGCIGYISDHGGMDLNIAIRTLECTAEKIQGSFGGGIVYDSDAEQEYQECFHKAKNFL